MYCNVLVTVDEAFIHPKDSPSLLKQFILLFVM